MIRRRRATDVAAGGLTPQVVAVLLGGWQARSPTDPADEDDDGVWDLFFLDDRGLGALWTQHAAWLQQEAARLHVVRAFDVDDGHPCFFAESLAARLRSGRL